MRSALLLTMAAAGLGFIIGNLPSLAGDRPLPAPRGLADAALDFSKFQLQGAGSCPAAPCHNGNRAPATTGREYSTRILHDKHSRAHEAPFEKRPRLIEKILLNRPP